MSLRTWSASLRMPLVDAAAGRTWTAMADDGQEPQQKQTVRRAAAHHTVSPKFSFFISTLPARAGRLFCIMRAQLSVVPVAKLAMMIVRMEMGATNFTSTL